jgi:uncharacterized protein YgiM (DUF1202 family)
MATRRWSIGSASKAPRVFSVLILLATIAAALASPWTTGQALAAEFATGDSVVVDTDGLNFRDGPGLSHTIVNVLAGGVPLTVTGGPETANGIRWYEVRTGEDTTGWVAGDFLALVKTWSRFAAGDLAVVDVARLNCRTSPGLDADVIYVIDGGTEVDVLAGPTTADGYHWYRVQTADGDVGWVAGEWLTPPRASTGYFGKGDEVVVDTDRLNLRVGAGLDMTLVDVLPGGTPLIVSNGPVTADGYDWYEVETRDGRLGWVAGDYLAVAPGLGFAIGDAVRVANGRQNLRAAPGLDADVRRVMENNEVLLIREGPVGANGYTWYRVWNYGGEGWAAGEFLRFEPGGFPDEGGG